MKKIALYTSFVGASLTDAIMFFTSTNYLQLAVAIFLYLPLVYLALKLFPRKNRSEPVTVTKDNTPLSTASIQPNPTPIRQPDPAPLIQSESGEVEVSDINRRAFLKLIGATGLSFFISSLLSKKVETQLLGRSSDTGITTLKDATGNIINPAERHPIDDYKISEVDYGIETFYGFIDSGESWFIMKEDVNAGTYRYVKGGTNFRDNWNNRQDLKYDYFNRVFPKP